MTLYFLLLVLGTVFIFSILFWVFFFKSQDRAFSYWSQRNIISAPTNYFVGNCYHILVGQKSFAEQVYWWYEMSFMASKVRRTPILGVYVCNKPGLLLKDLALIKMVFNKHGDSFMNRPWRTVGSNDPLSVHNPFYARLPYWQQLHDELVPFFTNAQIKQWYPHMYPMGHLLENELRGRRNGEKIELRAICCQFTSDIICRVAFGKEPDDEFNSRSDFHNNFISRLQNTIKCGFDFVLMSVMPRWIIYTIANIYTKKQVEYLRDCLRAEVDKRMRTDEVQNDFVDELVRMKRAAQAQPYVKHLARKFDYLVGQAAIFQKSGFETCTATMMFALYELALNPKLQQRLRTEITKYLNFNKFITFERLLEMPFMTQVVNETLRKYPPVAFLERECTPDKPDHVSLVPHVNYVVPKGMSLFVSVLGIHRDSRYWSSPEQFNPDRFAATNKSKINMEAFIPYGIGPRGCLGYRMGVLKTKLFLAHFLRCHRVSKCPQTVANIEFDPFVAQLTPRDPIYLRLDHI